ncbi:MAG: PHP domain-containing protein, partial [Negativicutes bacterium]|nr:PHP domain-containing protein [Negativicutes bacterium]
MHTYCVLPDNTAMFWAFADTIPELAAYKPLLASSRITRVEVNTSENSWNIHIECDPHLPLGILDIAANYLKRQCGLSLVSFTVASKPQRADILQYLTAHWQELIEQVSTDYIVRRLLCQIKWRYEKYQLFLETNSRLAADILIERNVPSAIEQLLSQTLTQPCQVNLVISEEATSPEPCEGELLTPEYLEALDQYTAVAEAKPAKAGNIIFGRSIKGESQPISTLTDEAKNVIVGGELVAFDLRALKSGRFLLTFDLHDMTDGISGKAFFDDQEQYNKVAAALSEGMMVKVKGIVQYDKYCGELVLFADSMCSAEAKPSRMDEAAEPRVELHAHTRMSTLDAVVSVKSLIKTAARWKHPAIAITDHGVVQAFPEAHEEA